MNKPMIVITIDLNISPPLVTCFSWDRLLIHQLNSDLMLKNEPS